MLTTLAGLPADPLFVHAAVTLVPLAAIVTAIALIWPAAHRRLGFITPLLAWVAFAATAVAKSAGEAWVTSFGNDPDTLTGELGAHAQAGSIAVIVALILAVMSTLWWLVGASALTPRLPAALRSTGMRLVLGLITLAAIVAAVWFIIAAGHSGAALVWSS